MESRGQSSIRLAVLVSGAGTTLQNLIDEIAAVRLDASIALVIGSRDGLSGVERARRAGISTRVIDRKKFADVASFSRAVFSAIDASGAELVCLAGWLCLLSIPDQWHGRVLNIHPALLPRFGGKGMFGRHVHQAVLESGETESGCTVHFVDNTYDTGPIILQKRCVVRAGDSVDTLAARVFELEKQAYPEAIRLYAARRIRDGVS